MIQATAEQRRQVKEIMDDCQQRLANVVGRPVNIMYRIKVNHLSPELIIQQVCTACKVSYTEMVSKARDQEFVVARHLVMWLTTYYCGYSDDRIAKLVHRDDSTVRHALQTIKDRIELGDALYLIPLNQVEKQLLNILNPEESWPSK